MNPTTASLASFGAAGALIIVLVEPISKFTGWEPSANWQLAAAALVAWIASHWFHKLTPSAAISNPLSKGFGFRSLLLSMIAIGFSMIILFQLAGCATQPATIEDACNAIAQADGTFQQLAQQHPGIVDANGMATEGAAMAAVGLPVGGVLQNPKPAPVAGSVCAPPYQVTTATAETTVFTSALIITNLIFSWQK